MSLLDWIDRLDRLDARVRVRRRGEEWVEESRNRIE